MTKFWKRFKSWSLPTKLGLLIGVLGLMGGSGYSIYFNSETSNTQIGNGNQNVVGNNNQAIVNNFFDEISSPVQFQPKQFDLTNNSFSIESKGNATVEEVKWYLSGDKGQNILTRTSVALDYRSFVHGIVLNAARHMIEVINQAQKDNKHININGIVACHMHWLTDDNFIPIGVEIMIREAEQKDNIKLIGEIRGLDSFGNNSAAELKINDFDVSEEEWTNFLTSEEWSTELVVKIDQRSKYPNSENLNEDLNGFCK